MRAGRPKRNEPREMTTPMTFRLPISLAQAVRDEAEARAIDLSDVGRTALQRYLRKRLAQSGSALAHAS